MSPEAHRNIAEQAWNAAALAEREHLAKIADEVGAFYTTAEPNPEPPGGEVVGYHDFSDRIRKG